MRRLRPLANDEKTEAFCYTNPCGRIEIIAHMLGDVTHDGDDVIAIGAGSINIPKDDVPTIINQTSTLIGDLQCLCLNANVITVTS